MLTKLIRYQLHLRSIIHNFGKSRNILIHHGLLGSAQSFNHPQIVNTCQKHGNLHIIDARNHGESPHTETHSIQDLADDLYKYIDFNNLMGPSNKLTLIGHSKGGMALMQFTKLYDSPKIQEFIDRIIIIDIPTTPIKKGLHYRRTGTMLKSLQQIDMSQPRDAIQREVMKRAVTEAIGERVKQSLVTEDGRTRWKLNLKALAISGFENIGSFDLSTDNPGRWYGPVEVIYGEKSAYFNDQEYERFKAYYPSLTRDHCHKIEKAGHWVHQDNIEQFCQTLDHILKKDDKSS